MKFYQKSLIYKNTTLVRHWFTSKNWIFAIFFKKVSFDGFTHYFIGNIIFFTCPNFQKIEFFHITPIYLIYNYIRHFMTSIFHNQTIRILRIKIEKVSIDGLSWLFMVHFLIIFFIVQSVSKMKFYRKSLIYKNTNIVRHWFSSKNWIFAIFLKKVSIDGFSHFSLKIHPKFSKNRLFHIPQYIIYLLIRILCSFQQSNY